MGGADKHNDTQEDGLYEHMQHVRFPVPVFSMIRISLEFGGSLPGFRPFRG